MFSVVTMVVLIPVTMAGLAAVQVVAVGVAALRSERLDIRGELRNPFAGFTALRLRAGITDYQHDEVEDGTPVTTFQNKAHSARVELQHEPLAGWRG